MSTTAVRVGTSEVDPATIPPRTSGRKNRHRAVPLDQEFRKFTVPSHIEVRSKGDSNELVVEGTPIVYDTPYEVRDMFGPFQEEIRAGALSDLLSGDALDCRLLLNHDGLALARTASGTLTLTDSAEGLQMRATLDPRQQLANDFAIAIERGDMSQMSVGMIVGKDMWGEENRGTKEEPDYVETRVIERLDDLLDVSGVTYPASPTTSIAKRMVAAMPVESRARLRRLEVALRKGEASPEELLEALVALRAGQPTERPDHITRAAQALETVLESAGVDVPEEERSEEPEAEVPANSTRSGIMLALELRKRRR